MSGEDVSGGEFQRLLASIDSNNQQTLRCFEKVTQSIDEIKEHIIHNDYRHSNNESEIKSIKKDIAAILEILDERKPAWAMFKKSKIIIVTVTLGAMTAAGAGLYNYIFKPAPPVINQQKDKPAIKPVTRNLIK